MVKNMCKEISLEKWAELKFDPIPSLRTLQSWARTGHIEPKPRKIARRWLVVENADYIEPELPDIGDNNIQDPVILRLAMTN